MCLTGASMNVFHLDFENFSEPVVDRGQGLIEKENVRVRCECTCQRNALLLAT
jgi:hypothetical protein